MKRHTIALLVAGTVALAAPFGAWAEADVPVPKTYTEAMRWYRNSARAGDPKAMFYLGLTLERGLQDRPRPQEAVEWYRRSAEAGFALAQFKLGVLYQTGQAVDRDLAQARGWYEKAAAQGVASAQYNLAVLLETEEGGPADPARAADLYREAARRGVPEAFLNLGNLYANGEGVEADPVEALKWLILAVDAGIDAAEELRKSVLVVLSEDERARARSEAERWKIDNPH